jgi:hypothetical protein
MNFALPGASIFLSLIPLASSVVYGILLLTLLFQIKTWLNRVFTIFLFTATLWSIFAFLLTYDLSASTRQLVFWNDLLLAAMVFTGFAYYHFVRAYTGRRAGIVVYVGYGTAIAVVVKTGSSTEYGKIAQKLVERAPETEFEIGVRKFGFLIMQVTFLLVLFVFMINALFHPNEEGILTALLFAVALAVGLTPELLPMIITINLSKGALAMSKKGVIVKRLASIQDFGSMDVFMRR